MLKDLATILVTTIVSLLSWTFLTRHIRGMADDLLWGRRVRPDLRAPERPEC
jgi:hypothetical protein